MKLLRVALHGFILVVADLAGIGVGALVAFRALGVANQVWLQLPIAVGLSIALFFAWMFLLKFVRLGRLCSAASNELWACLFASVLWAPLIFVPLHYFTQGYVTSLGNLVALALYQVPVNAIAVFGWSGLSKTKVDPGDHQPDA